MEDNNQDFKPHEDFGDNALIAEIEYDGEINSIHKDKGFKDKLGATILKFLKINRYVPNNKERLCRFVIMSTYKNHDLPNGEKHMGKIKRYEFDVYALGEQLEILLTQAMEYAKKTEDVDGTIIAYKILKEFKEKN